MFLDFFLKLKKSKIPVSLNEFLIFLSALKLDAIQFDVNKFYYLARCSLVKDEKFFDKFDEVFSEYFKSAKKIELEDILKILNIPKSWLNEIVKKNFSTEEIKKIKTLGSFEKLIETLKKRLKDQKRRHIGGNKWIGTSGSSPFGAYGYNSEGIRIGQKFSNHNKAVKVWDKRMFKDFDNSKQLNNRGFKVALKSLRKWARTGIEDELDIEQTIKDTAKYGYLDIKTKKEKENSIKVLLFLDVGGSMDEYVEIVERLFSAAKNVFKNLKYFYFHNCLYEGVWHNNVRRWDQRFSTYEILRTYGNDYKCIFVGDASMSPYEIVMPGGGNEHYNNESGKVWLERAIKKWSSHLWINPTAQEDWDYSESICIIKNIFQDRMVPLSIKGIEDGIKILS